MICSVTQLDQQIQIGNWLYLAGLSYHFGRELLGSDVRLEFFNKHAHPLYG